MWYIQWETEGKQFAQAGSNTAVLVRNRKGRHLSIKVNVNTPDMFAGPKR